MFYYALTGLFNGIAFLAMGVFVYLKNPGRPVNRAYLFFSICISEWGFAYFLWTVFGKDHASGLFWSRVLNMGPTVLPVCYLHYILALFGWIKEKKRVLIFAYVVGFIFLGLSVTPLYVKDAVPKLMFPYYPTPGLAHPYFLLMFFGLAAYVCAIMIMFYPRATLTQRSQIKYLLAATILGYLGGGSNFLLFYNVPFPPIFNSLTGIYPIMLAYIIIRYKFFEIDTVIHRTALWLLTLLLVILPVALLFTFSMNWISALRQVEKVSLVSATLIFFVWYYSTVKPRVDQVFRRRKYDYYKVLSEIGQKVGSELDINNVVARLFRELKDVLYIRNGMVLVQPPGELNYIQAGSIGYENILEQQKREKAELDYPGALSQWLNNKKVVLEKEQVDIDPQYAAIRQEALAFLSGNSFELLIPVLMENKVNALIGIGKKENLQAYTMRDIELLGKMGRQIGITIDNALHHEDIVEKERLAEELKLGREIQVALLPQGNPEVQALTVQGLMQPAKEIGGDYYDFIAVPGDGSLAVVIGDVSGKGVAAGLLMAMAKTAIHTLSQENNSPKQILLRTNQILNQHIGGQKFMTLLYLLWQPQTKIFTYSSAGHEHILLYHAKTQTLEAIQSGGFMLGMLPDIDKFLEEKQIQLQPHDKIVLYTDGVTEAENQAKDRFGLDRLKESFKKHSLKSAPELIQAIKEDVYSFIGNHPQYDDITLVVMEAT
jgi:serine phosphatase RsbU (regulator of sigma subunit)